MACVLEPTDPHVFLLPSNWINQTRMNPIAIEQKSIRMFLLAFSRHKTDKEATKPTNAESPPWLERQGIKLKVVKLCWRTTSRSARRMFLLAAFSRHITDKEATKPTNAESPPWLERQGIKLEVVKLCWRTTSRSTSRLFKVFNAMTLTPHSPSHLAELS